MEFEHPDISSIWEETNEVETSRIILKAYGPSGVSAQRVLAAFREVYPGKHDTIVQALRKTGRKINMHLCAKWSHFQLGKCINSGRK